MIYPGTPSFRGSIDMIISKAIKETEVYLQNDIVSFQFILLNFLNNNL